MISPAPVKPTINAAQSSIGLGFAITARTLVTIAVMTSSGLSSSIGVLRFLVVSVAFYGMSTLEGPLMGVRQVNALSHYTDWTVGHVHSGALGWVGFITFGAMCRVHGPPDFRRP